MGGERCYCCSEVDLNDPEHRTKGEILCAQVEDPEFQMPAGDQYLKLRAAAQTNRRLGGSRLFPWGAPVRPVTLNNTSYTEPDAPSNLYSGHGKFYVDHSRPTPWGLHVRAYVPIGCVAEHGHITHDVLGGGAEAFAGVNFAEHAKLEAAIEHARSADEVSNCCIERFDEGPGCEDAACQEAVCEHFPTCCPPFTAWGDECVSAARQLCGTLCDNSEIISSLPWGQRILWHGNAYCNQFRGGLPDQPSGLPGLPVNYRPPYTFDLFGVECAVCDSLLFTAAVPCLDCSYDQGHGHRCNVHHAETRFRSCTCDEEPSLGDPDPPHFFRDPFVNAGEATCVGWWPGSPDPENYHVHCQFDENGGQGEHFCESCVFHRNIGWLATEVLRRSHALERIELRGARVPNAVGGRCRALLESRRCDYGCGEFGFETAGIANKVPIDAAWLNDNTAPRDFLQIEEAQHNDCIAPGLPVYSDDGGEDMYKSCFPRCSTGISCECFPGAFCEGTHTFRWLHQDASFQGEGGMVKFEAENYVSATLCFKQREVCDPSLPPSDITGNACRSNPASRHNAGRFHYLNPTSTTIVDVRVRIEVVLSVLHWGSLGGGCACCAAFGVPFVPALIKVKMVGEWCGPMAWGDVRAGRWPGHAETPPGGEWPGIMERPSSWSHLSSPPNFCGNLFQNQGRYDDCLDRSPGSDCPSKSPHRTDEPPKRCTSWETKFHGAPVQFWCPPFVHWTWGWSGGLSNTYSTISQPNQHQRTPQCWAAEPIRMDAVHGCQGGNIEKGDGEPRRPCTPVGCRRGCSVFDDSFVQPTGDFISPCSDDPPWRRDATPWGCGHCHQTYPPTDGPP